MVDLDSVEQGEGEDSSVIRRLCRIGELSRLSSKTQDRRQIGCSNTGAVTSVIIKMQVKLVG